ncbi:hypothetical protein DPEC_G00218730 [Dallia pectoralis]|uniref:Uncharacterized protein n=1 Tax=Dallia pectoralis TaxID=75939 RepID=A0ACC2G3G1_DALPE|nr:hypothetical protein DPEC_G00218730 [Dallia pectoralis]
MGQGRAPLQQYQVGAPIDRVTVDVLGPFPRTPRGNRFVVVAMDYFTKWPEAYAVPDQEAATVCEVLIEGMFSWFGVPTELHSDQGRNFEAQLFAKMCRQLAIHKTRTTPLRPQSDGLVERFNRTLGAQLALVVAKDQKDWDRQLPLVLLAYRSATQESTGCTLALLMFGRELRTPPALVYGQPPDSPRAAAGPEYAHQLWERLEVAHEFARRQAVEAGMRQKRAYDQHTKGAHYQGGDLVWVYGPKRVKGRSPKLDSKWIGPCCVLERVGEVVYRVKMAPRGRVVVLHRDRMAPYRGSARPAYERGTHSPSPIRDQPIQGQPASAVRVLRGTRRRGGTTGPSRQRGGASQEEIQVTPLGAVIPPIPEEQGEGGRPWRRRRVPQRFREYEVELLGDEEI